MITTLLIIASWYLTGFALLMAVYNASRWIYEKKFSLTFLPPAKLLGKTLITSVLGPFIFIPIIYVVVEDAEFMKIYERFRRFISINPPAEGESE